MTNKIRFILIAAFAVVLTVILTASIKTYANDRRGREYRESVKRNEAEYVRDIRKYLDDNGFKNAGINLTKEYDEERNVTYILLVNHHSFEYTSDDKIESMEDRFLANACEYLDGGLKTEFSF